MCVMLVWKTRFGVEWEWEGGGKSDGWMWHEVSAVSEMWALIDLWVPEFLMFRGNDFETQRVGMG